ncbi:hypothetical protein AB0K53_04380 [Streptomyces tuirus]|uniref:hypothetical protein n=1 Tax=Streptomyces tuirus TaxID=68278 RepID=UPI003438AD6B
MIGGIFLIVTSGSDDGKGEAKPSAAATTHDAKPTTGSLAGSAAPSPPSLSSPSSKPSPKASPAYALIHEDLAMAVTLPGCSEVALLDFDAPSSRTADDELWQTEKQEAEEQNESVAADFVYSNCAKGYLGVPDSKQAAHWEEQPPASPEACAQASRVGGWTAQPVSEARLKAKSGFCVVTDQGNVVSLQITRLVGGEPGSLFGPPERIEFAATVWGPEA